MCVCVRVRVCVCVCVRACVHTESAIQLDLYHISATPGHHLFIGFTLTIREIEFYHLVTHISGLCNIIISCRYIYAG